MRERASERRRWLCLPALPASPAILEFSPGGALPGSRVCRAHGRACARARVAAARERSREGKGGRAPARPLSSPRPRTRVWLCRWRLTADGGSLPALALLRPLPLLASPHRSGPRVCPLFPVRLFRSVPFLGGGARPVPLLPLGDVEERPASASRRPLAVAPGRACRTEPASCEGARPGASSRRRWSSLPRLPPPTPVRVPSYRVPARRFKDPRGGRLLRPRGRGGGGARREPSAAGGSRGLPFLTRRVAVPEARRRVRGSGAPSRAPVGLASACPVRRCVVGREPRVCRSLLFPSRPALVALCLFFACLAGRPEANPSPLAERGLCRRQLFSERKTLVRLLAVDHSARASMKNAASCEN